MYLLDQGNQFRNMGYMSVLTSIVKNQKYIVLVDTDDTVTLVYTRLYQMLLKAVKPSLHAIQHKLISANSTHLSLRC